MGITKKYLLLILFTIGYNISAYSQGIKFEEIVGEFIQIGDNNIQNNYGFSKKQFSKIETLLQQLNDNHIILQHQLDSIKISNNRFWEDFISSKNKENKRLSDEVCNLLKSLNSVNSMNSYLHKRINELEQVLDLHQRMNFAPFGIKQLKYKNTALGCTFLVSQIAVPVALGVGLDGAANHNYKLHQERIAITREKHTEYYRKYKGLHKAAIYTPIASAAGIYLINVLCNYYCTKIELTPQTISGPNNMDITGLSLSFNF